MHSVQWDAATFPRGFPVQGALPNMGTEYSLLPPPPSALPLAGISSQMKTDIPSSHWAPPKRSEGWLDAGHRRLGCQGIGLGLKAGPLALRHLPCSDRGGEGDPREGRDRENLTR